MERSTGTRKWIISRKFIQKVLSVEKFELFVAIFRSRHYVDEYTCITGQPYPMLTLQTGTPDQLLKSEKTTEFWLKWISNRCDTVKDEIIIGVCKILFYRQQPALS